MPSRNRYVVMSTTLVRPLDRGRDHAQTATHQLNVAGTERAMDVQVSGGRVRGTEEGGVVRFLGVPYAAAPRRSRFPAHTTAGLLLYHS